MTRRVLISATLIFAIAGLFGPAIRLITWPPSKFASGSSPSFSEFIYQLVFLLWPAQPLAVMEANMDRALALSLAVGTNVFLFSIAGVAAALVARRRFSFAILYLAVCGLVLLLAMWGAGFSFAHVNMLALITALLLYAVPFWAMARSVDPLIKL